MSNLTKPEAETLVLRPTSGFAALNLRDLWVYRELLVFLTWRDIAVRYKQTALGVLWAIIQPVVQMVIFTFLFNRVAQISSGDIPYPIFAYTGLLPWGLFAKALNDAGKALVSNRNMITKVYFPRLVIPIASTLSGVFDFLISALVLVGLLIYYSVTGAYVFTPTPTLWLLPVFIFMAVITALSVGLWFTTLNVQYRDFGYLLGFLSQVWMFVTPVVYPVANIPAEWQFIYSLNPMVGVVEGFRWAVFGFAPPGPMIFVSAGVTLVLLIGGLFYFRRMESSFADTI
jgi:lipopolysaccharide transport system permease protein